MLRLASGSRCSMLILKCLTAEHMLSHYSISEKRRLCGQRVYLRLCSLRKCVNAASDLSLHWRVVMSALLLVVLLVPPASAVLSFALKADASSSCGMDCCKRAKTCCCRRTGKHETAKGANWAASPSCPKGCRVFPVRTGFFVSTSPPCRSTVARLVPSFLISAIGDYGLSLFRIPLDLFQRPPPNP
jgi:hypothetical protein